MKGYKVFNPDWTCRGFQYEVGKVYEIAAEPIICEKGFHFCKRLQDCFNYYEFDPNNRIAIVETLGKILQEDDICCTNKIKICEEMQWTEVLEIVNTGDYNSGNRNSGNYNSGSRNSGNHNSGKRNNGNWNSGDYNSGDYNSGNRNSGNWNSGHYNSGDYNSGDYNNGNRNSGNYNSGHYNNGNRNSGNYNSGHYNSGNRNSGNYNSGHHNSGYHNSGDYNVTNHSSGCFNTKETTIVLFNKNSNWTYNDWRNSEAKKILGSMPIKELVWIYENNMTKKEKAKYPEYETTGGVLREVNAGDERQKWWDELPLDDKKTIFALPNFDANIFEQCTGIKIK